MAAQTRCALTKTAGSFASRNENLWIHAKLKLCLLVIQKPPFQAEEDIVRSDRVATSVLFENFDQEFEFQLRLRQSVIQIEQKRIHLCCISRVELAPGIGHETWAGLRQINTTHQPMTPRRSKFSIDLPEGRMRRGIIYVSSSACGPQRDQSSRPFHSWQKSPRALL